MLWTLLTEQALVFEQEFEGDLDDAWELEQICADVAHIKDEKVSIDHLPTAVNIDALRDNVRDDIHQAQSKSRRSEEAGWIGFATEYWFITAKISGKF